MHRAFLIAHRWLALVVAVFLVVVALSGGLLVLEGPISRARQPHVVPAGARLPLDTLAQRARAAAGGGDFVMMALGDSPDLAWGVLLSSKSSRGAGGGTTSSTRNSSAAKSAMPNRGCHCCLWIPSRPRHGRLRLPVRCQSDEGKRQSDHRNERGTHLPRHIRSGAQPFLGRRVHHRPVKRFGKRPLYHGG